MIRPLAITALTLGVALAGVVPRARAETPAAEAKRLSSSANVDFRAGRLPEAEEKWEAAYKAGGEPFVLYALARCYQVDGKPDKALASYRAFLEKVPKSPKKLEVQKQIKELEKQVGAAPAPKPEEQKPEPTVAPKLVVAPVTSTAIASATAPPPPAAANEAPILAPAPLPPKGAAKVFNKGIVKKWWFWTAIAGVVVVGAAVAVGVVVGTEAPPAFPDVGPGLSSSLNSSLKASF